ncbi:MAG: hypothetical protein K1X74_19075 [Pirellulales bacterium]|nr:hypothetical protein [Pirellulales bacterium]
MTNRIALRLENLPIEMIEEALRAAQGPVSFEMLVAVQQFVDRIGGIENAYLAVQMLQELEAEDDSVEVVFEAEDDDLLDEAA